jgi:hypothetical protein
MTCRTTTCKKNEEKKQKRKHEKACHWRENKGKNCRELSERKTEMEI